MNCLYFFGNNRIQFSLFAKMGLNVLDELASDRLIAAKGGRRESVVRLSPILHLTAEHWPEIAPCQSHFGG